MLDVVAAEEAGAAATAEEETDAGATEEELYEMLATEAANDDETAEEEETVDEVKTAEDENTYCDEVAMAVLVPKRFSGAGVGMAISWAASWLQIEEPCKLMAG